MSEDNPIVPRKGGELTKIGPKGNPILDTMVRDALQLAKESSELSEEFQVQFKCKNLERDEPAAKSINLAATSWPMSSMVEATGLGLFLYRPVAWCSYRG